MRPILFTLPFLDLPVYAYGTMLYRSLVAGWLLSLRLADADGLDRRTTKVCIVITAIAAIVGARLLFVITNPGVFHHVLDVFNLARGGLVAYGGFLGGLIGSIVFCRYTRVPLLVWADCAVPTLCTGLAITRIGCLLAGCDFGARFDGPWGIQFPQGSPAFEQQVLEGLLPIEALWSLPVHPTQIYESLAGLCLLALVMSVRRIRRSPGEALAAFALGYGVLRYMIEIVRADPQRGSLGPWSTSQVIAFVTSAAAIVLITWLRASPPDLSRLPRRIRS